MAFHWGLKKEVHIADPKKGGGYHCHLLYKRKRTKFITCQKVEKKVKFVYLQEHGEGRNPISRKPKGQTKKLIGQLTIKVLKNISANDLMIPENGAELIHKE